MDWEHRFMDLEVESDDIVEMAGEDPIDIKDYIDEVAPESGRCGICLDIIIDRGALDCCNHWFCFACIDNWATITNLCPLCKTEFQLITCIPVYDTLGNFMVDRQITSSSRNDDDWIIQEKNNALSFPSYYISEDAVKCLDDDGCKIRSGFPMSTTEEDLILDTSIACDSCDVWYHAFCVGFDPQNQPGNSWLCPRCIMAEMPQKHDKKIAEIGHSVESTLSTKVSISVADEGETAIVISMIEGQQSREAMDRFRSMDQVEVSKANLHEVSSHGCDADMGEADIPENDIMGSQFLYDGILPIGETKSINPATDVQDNSTVLLDMSSESALEVKVPGSLSVLSLSDTILDEVPIEHRSFDFDPQVLPAMVSQTEKAELDTSAASAPSDEIIADHDCNNDVDDSGTKGEDMELVRNNKASASTKDQCGKRSRDPHCKTTNDLFFKKAKSDRIYQTKQQTNTSADDSQGHIKIDAVCKEDKLPSTSGKDNPIPEIMSIVKGVRNKPCTIIATNSSADKIAKGDSASGVRVKKIMHRAGEISESTDIVQKLRKQIRDVVSSKPSEDVVKDDAFDNKLLAAFRAAIVRPKAEATSKANPSILRFSKPILQRGKVRENLTKKIYRTNGRLRRAWDRDCEIEFWKHRCSNSKPKKVEALQSVLDILQGITSSPGNSGNKQESKGDVKNSILSRVYLADTSVFPRKEEIKSLSDLTGSSIIPNVDQSKGHHLNDYSGKNPQLVCGANNLQETTSTSAQVTQSLHAKEEVNSLRLRNKKEHPNELKSGSLQSNPALNGSKENLQPLAKEDKRKWALEVLARKNASTNRGKDQERQEDHTLVKGSFPLLAQLPVDMRPVVAPSRHSKVPLSIRQVQLYRLTEFYLRKADVPVVRRTAATELAVADAINIEKEIFERSNSKLVYINLCSQHTVNCHPHKAERINAEQPTVPREDVVQQVNEHTGSDSSGACAITEALKLTGLFSDSPPSDPDRSIRSPCSRDSAEVDLENGDFENVLDMDCNTELDIYRDFEYDLEDEGYIVLKSLPPASNHLQSDDSELKMKVVLSTMNSEKLSKTPEADSTRGEQQTSHSFDSLTIAEAKSDVASVPICEKEGSAVSPSSKTDTGGSSSALDLVDEEKYEESSLAECEDLYGPENKHLEEDFGGNEMVVAKNVVPCEGDGGVLKNVPLVSNFEYLNDAGNVMARGEVLPSHSLSNKVFHGEEILTPSNQEPSRDSISQKVEAYIKEHIRPLCKSGIITAEQYRWAVGKTRYKVMKYHCKAKNANFLIKEGDKVKKLAQQYAEAASKQQAIRR